MLHLLVILLAGQFQSKTATRYWSWSHATTYRPPLLLNLAYHVCSSSFISLSMSDSTFPYISQSQISTEFGCSSSQDLLQQLNTNVACQQLKALQIWYSDLISRETWSWQLLFTISKKNHCDVSKNSFPYVTPMTWAFIPIYTDFEYWCSLG